MDDLMVEKVLRAVECVPVGHVATYGQIAACVGIGPRQVGQVMARVGSAVPWWRVVNARGSLPHPLSERARPHWLEEGTEISEDGRGVVLRNCRVKDVSFVAAVTRSLAGLPESHSTRDEEN